MHKDKREKATGEKAKTEEQTSPPGTQPHSAVAASNDDISTNPKTFVVESIERNIQEIK